MSLDLDVSVSTEDNDDLSDLIGKITGDIKDRTTWEVKQRTWYELRYGLDKRISPPHPGAVDLHFPLIDSHIDKLKPFYVQQYLASEVIAEFVATQQQDALAQSASENAATQAARYLDCQLKHNSNFEIKMLSGIDTMLETGIVVVKITWDFDAEQICFEAINPTQIIVPYMTKSLAEADRVVQVYEMSVAEYKRRGVALDWDTSKDTIAKIKGSGDNNACLDAAKRAMRQTREGITHSAADSVVVWEVYTRDDDGRTWEMETISPVGEVSLKKKAPLPYQHNELPFIEFTVEVTNGNWYSPRGVAELDAAFQKSIKRLWNQKHDCIDYSNQPTFRAEREIVNPGNVRMSPGQLLPYGVVPNQVPPPPISFDQEIISTRQVAEQRIGIPDYAVGQALNTDQRRTATEVQAVGQRSAQSDDLRARIFRMRLAPLLKQAWSLLVQYQENSAYLSSGTYTALDGSVKQVKWRITPAGSSDSWNRPALLQKAIARKQLLGGSQFVDQAELDKSIIELDDPRLVARLFRDPKQREADQTKAAAMVCLCLEAGMPVLPEPQSDYAIHAIFCGQRLMQLSNDNIPDRPNTPALFQQYIQACVELLAQRDPEAAKQIQGQLLQMQKMAEQQLAQRQAAAAQQQAIARGEVPLDQIPYGRNPNSL